MMIRRIAFVSGLVILNAFGFATVARAGEGGIAGSAAFTVTSDKVTGVAVSAAVGKQSAAAHSFNYDAANANGLQNSAFAIGTGGLLDMTTLGTSDGFNLSTTADPALNSAQTNTFSAGTVTVQIGTTSGNAVVKAP